MSSQHQHKVTIPEPSASRCRTKLYQRLNSTCPNHISSLSNSAESFSTHASHPVSLSPLSTISLASMSDAGPSSSALTRARNKLCEMERLFSRESRYTVWRKLWLWLAESQKQLGIVYLVPIPDTRPQEFTKERIIDDQGLEQLRRCCVVLSYQVNSMQMRNPIADHLLVCGARCSYVERLI